MVVKKELLTGPHKHAIQIKSYNGTYHSGITIDMIDVFEYNSPIATFWLSVNNDRPDKDAAIKDLITIRNAIDDFIKLCQN